MAPFRLSRMRSKSKLKPTAPAEEAAPAAEGGTANAPGGALSHVGADSESGGDSSPARPSSPPPIPVEFAQVRAPMAKKLSFARRRSREEQADLTAATPDDNSQDAELLSPASAQLLRSALQAEADEGIASSLLCPITGELMTDPVFTMDGQTYERSAIEAWLQTSDTSPATGKPLPSKMLVANVRARSMLHDLPEQVPLT